MSAAKSFATFTTYTPPPDDIMSTSKSAVKTNAAPPVQRPWFPVHANSSSSGPAALSYQSGGLPTFGDATSSNVVYGSTAHDVDTSNQWQTRFGWRVDMLAGVAYLGGPLTALFLLIIETTNDYVRFHAYQSALLTTPLILFIVFVRLLGLPIWMLVSLSVALVTGASYMAFRAYSDTVHQSMAHYRLPILGELADKWVADE